jgi:hypothetical protein
MTTYVLAVFTKAQKQIIETHRVEEVRVVEGSAVENMAPVDLWRGARLVFFDMLCYELFYEMKSSSLLDMLKSRLGDISHSSHLKRTTNI